MAKLNNNYFKLKAGYLFPEIARRVNSFTENNPEGANKIIRCGIGDVTEPLALAAREAMKAAIDELGNRDTFKGYGPEQGYDFLRSAIAKEIIKIMESKLMMMKYLFPMALNVTRETS